MNHHTTFAAVPALNWVLFLLLAGALIAAYLWTRPTPVADEDVTE